jgi:hypothetical protein
MAAYLRRYTSATSSSVWGLLAYPQDPIQSNISYAEKNSPWSLDEGKNIVFTALPHNASEAIGKLSNLLKNLQK